MTARMRMRAAEPKNPSPPASPRGGESWLSRSARAAVIIALLAGAASSSALAQLGARNAPAASQELRAPNMADGVLRAMEAAYLNDAERSSLRIFHGVWRESDLAEPAARARAALAVGAWDDPSLSSAGAAPEDRAEAALRRGEADAVPAILGEVQSPRAMRLRAQALESLGRFADARAAIEPLLNRLANETIEDAPTLTEAVRAMVILARLDGRPAGDYQAMTRLTARAHQQIDRLYWPAKLVEAELMLERDVREQAHGAAIEVLALNPSCAGAWSILGTLAVGSFDFGTAEKVADKLARLRTRLPGMSGTHPQGDLILAGAWLRQNDPDLAEQQLSGPLAAFPKWREGLATRAAITAVRYDFSRVEQLLKEFDALSPGSPVAVYAVGRALAENRQYTPAAEYLNRAIALQPNWAAPVTELGLMEMQSGRDAEALAALERSREIDPFNERAKHSLTLIEDLITWNIEEGEFFRVRAQNDIDRTVARDMLAVLDEIHRRVSAEFEHSPPNKTMLELMPDHSHFAVRITGMPALHTVAAATGPLIAMEAPKEGKGHNGEYDWARVIQHEYTHTVTLSLTNNRIPHWFTEAAAVHMEQRPRDYNTCQLLVNALRAGELFDLRKINISFVRPEKPSDRSQAYAQGHWMYSYIVQRWGKQSPIELMKLYAQGIRQPEAMQRVLGISEAQFLADFKEFAAKDAASWGMMPSPSLDELRLRATMSDEVSRESAAVQLAEYAAGVASRLSGGAGPQPYKIDLAEPTDELVAQWSKEYPEHPDLLELRLMSAIAAAGGKATSEHIPLLEQYAAARPVDPMPHRELARLHLASEDKNRANDHLEFLDLREQNSSAYALELARRYESLNEWEKAAAKAERAVQIGPYDGNNREAAARIAIQAGDLKAAERHIYALTVLEPQYKKHQERLEAIRKLIAAKASPAG